MGFEGICHGAAGKCDGIFGTCLSLFLGFVYQALWLRRCGVKEYRSFSYSALLVFLLVYVGFLRKWLIRKWVGDIEARFREKQP